MMLSDNEKVAALREAASLGVEYMKALRTEGMNANDALNAMNNFVVMFLATKGVIPKMDSDDDEKWKNG